VQQARTPSAGYAFFQAGGGTGANSLFVETRKRKWRKYVDNDIPSYEDGARLAMSTHELIVAASKSVGKCSMNPTVRAPTPD
jgi:hypothetical protein